MKHVLLKNAMESDTFSVGDTVLFGTYEQDGDINTPIEWLILEKEGDKLLLISKYAIESHVYSNFGNTWKDSELRDWLNKDFFDKTFSSAEKELIAENDIVAARDPRYPTDPGEDTKDKVFLLSIEEAKRYFATRTGRRCIPAEYAVEHGADVNDCHIKDNKATCWWWLRSPGMQTEFTAFVRSDGSISDYGTWSYHRGTCVRPALWVNI